jgi:hypothetical protein
MAREERRKLDEWNGPIDNEESVTKRKGRLALSMLLLSKVMWVMRFNHGDPWSLW